MTIKPISHEIGEALWAAYAPQCPDLSLRVELQPEAKAYYVGMRTRKVINGQATTFITTDGIKRQGVGHEIAEAMGFFDERLAFGPKP